MSWHAPPKDPDWTDTMGSIRRRHVDFLRWAMNHRPHDEDVLNWIWGISWCHNRAGYTECLLCQVEAGEGHEDGCPVGKLEEKLPK